MHREGRRHYRERREEPVSPVFCCKRSGVRRGKRILGGCTMEKGLGRVFMLFAEGYARQLSSSTPL